MVSVLFWNLAENAATLPHLHCLGLSRSIDIFLLAESPVDLATALAALNTMGRGNYREAGKVRHKVRTLTRLPSVDLDHLYTTVNGETAVWSVRASKMNPPEVLSTTTHLPAKAGGQTDAGQTDAARTMAEELVGFEEQRKHRNTVVVGDFNMNPYDPGMTMVTGLHGLMTSHLARMRDRLYRKRRYRRFYNPMWGLFGDRTAGPAGTYYWQSKLPHNTHWAMFDQVLLRPALIDRLTKLEIIDHDGKHPLLASTGVPDKRHLSDHLPIYAVLDV